jgi:hypothetical protein
VPSNQPAQITVLQNPGTGTAGARVADAIIFRVTDAAGLTVTTLQPSVTAATAGAQVSSLSTDSAIPDAFTFTVRLSSQPGNNLFQIQEGGLSATVTIVGQ